MNSVVLGGSGFLGSTILSSIQGDSAGRSEDNDVYVDILKPRTLKKLDSYDVVINCVGLSPLRKPSVPYKQVHVNGVENIVSALKNQRLIHISAAGVHQHTQSEYLKTKLAGENIAKTYENSCIIRPGVIVGEGSEIFRALELTRWFRIFPKIKTQIKTVPVQNVVSLVEQEMEKQTQTLVTAATNTTTVTALVENEVGRILKIPEVIWRPFFDLAVHWELAGLTQEQAILLREGMN